jgi:hypothetical protein
MQERYQVCYGINHLPETFAAQQLPKFQAHSADDEYR